MRKKKVGIYDVAIAAGVSRGTVSRAFNKNRKDINENTRKKILEIARKMRYFPNTSARGLVKGTSESIGVIVPDLKNPFLCEMVMEIEKYAAKKGYSSLLALNNNDFNTQEIILSKMTAGQVDGIIITPCEDTRTIASLNRFARKKPLVCLKKFNGLRCDIVSFDDVLGIQIMLEYLISKGHSKIVYLSPEDPMWTVEERRSAFSSIMNASGLAPKFLSVGKLEPDSDEFKKLIFDFFDSGERPTAIFAYDDFFAIHLIRLLKELKIMVPEEVSVAGFDNISLGKFIEPSLSTIAIDGVSIGRQAIETIFSKIEPNDTKFERFHDIKLIPKIIERKSVADKKEN